MTGAILGAIAGLIAAVLGWEMIQRRRYGAIEGIPLANPPRFPRLTYARVWGAAGMFTLGGSLGWTWADRGTIPPATAALAVVALACFVAATLTDRGRR